MNRIAVLVFVWLAASAAASAAPYGGMAASIPGTIRAENFDDGGEGVGYHDASSGNAGGQYRATDVDIASDGAGGFVVGWVGAGEWLAYTVNVAASGQYTASFQVASLAAGGTFHLEMNGVNVSGALTVPDTGGWLTWRTISATVTLTAGTQIARLVMDTNGVNAVGNFKTMAFTAAASSPGSLRAFRGTPAAVPGRIEAAEFDEGGEGVAYHDENAGNTGGALRSTDVDIAASSEGGYTIGWIGPREWVNYTVNVAHAGAYGVQLRVASPSGGGQLHIGFNGSPGSWTAVAIPATGGWQTWATVTVPLNLNPGVQQITLLFDTGGYNVSYINVPDSASTQPPPTTNGSTISVPAGGDLQAAIDSAKAGDTILLAAGATYTGAFHLPVKSGSSYVTIRSNTPDVSLPADGTRVTPADASRLARVQGGVSGLPAFATDLGAHHYRLQFLEVVSGAGAYDLVRLGDSSGQQTTLASVPHDLIIDRCYIHGSPSTQHKHGIALDSASTTIVNSYIADIHSGSWESQAIGGWNGPGPFTIQNNYLEASGETILFGGADPTIPNLVPSDITIRQNTITKQLAWRGSANIVKNLIELKNAQRVVIDGNLLENNWVAAQNGFAVLFTPRNQDGGSPWAVVQNVQFTNNVVRHVAAGISVLGTDDLHSSQPTNTLTIRNNLFVDVTGVNWGGNGRWLQLLGGRDITVDHNTVLNDSMAVGADGPQVTGFTFTNNIVPDNGYAVVGSGAGVGSAAIARYFPQSLWLDNVFAGSNPAAYPTGNYYPKSLADVGFVDANGNYRLAASSLYKRGATDGTDVGCNIDTLNQATNLSF